MSQPKVDLSRMLAAATYSVMTGRILDTYDEGLHLPRPEPSRVHNLGPLDEIAQPPLDLERLCTLFPKLKSTLAPLLSLEAFEALLIARDPLPRRAPPSRLTRADVRMLRTRVAQSISPAAVKHMMVAFKTPKTGKPVTRLLFNAKLLNAAFQRPPKCNMAFFESIRRKVFTFQYGQVLDLANAFYQHPLPSGASAYFTFRCAGHGILAFTRMAQGWTWAPFLQQSYVLEILTVVEDYGCASMAILDDLLVLAATEDRCHQGMNALRGTLAEINATVHDTKSMKSPCSQFDYGGVTWDLRGRRWRLSSPFCDKWTAWMSIVPQTHTLPIRIWVSLVCVALYMVRILALCPSHYRPLFAWYSHTAQRIHMGTLSYDSRAQLWASTHTCLSSFHAILTTNSWCPYIETTRVPYDIWTDASLTGFGMMYVKRNTRLVMTAIYGPFQFMDDIHILELQTACWAIMNVVLRSPKRTCFTVLCDNTIAVALLKRMRGSCWKSHLAILPLAEALHAMQSELIVHWVSTKTMLADKLTRLRHIGTVRHEGIPLTQLVKLHDVTTSPYILKFSEDDDHSPLG